MLLASITNPLAGASSIAVADDLKRHLVSWITDPAHPSRAVRFSETAARESLRVAKYRLKSALEQLEAESVLVRYSELGGGRFRGWGMRGALPPRRTLADLLTLVEATPEPGATERPRSGRRAAAAEQTAVTALTMAQKRDIKGVAVLIAENAPGALSRAENVSAAFLARTVDRDGRRVWELEEEVLDWADARARAKAEARGLPWNPARNVDARAKHAGAVRLLLRLAVSCGWMESDEDECVVRTHSAEWQPHVLKWRARLLRRTAGKSEPSIRTGLQVLARVATRRGETDPATTDWTAVLREVEDDAVAGRLKPHLRNAVRWVWRRIHLLSRTQHLPRVHEQRLSIVASAAIERTVASLAAAKTAAEIDFGGWTVDGVPMTGLIEGADGLRRIMWFSAGRPILVAGDTTLPKRQYESTYRRRLQREAITPVTADARLRQFALLAGWAVRHDGASFGRPALGAPGSHDDADATTPADGPDTDTLLTLLDTPRLTRYCDWRGEQPKYLTTGAVGAGNGALSGMLATARRTLADLRMLAEHDGETARIEHLTAQIEVVERLRAEAKSEADKFRDCLQINAAWRPDGGRHGLEKLVDLRDLLVGDACGAAGGMTVDAQLGELRAWRAMPERTRKERTTKLEALAAMTWRTATWATALRRAFLVQLVRKVPLREEALQNLTVAMLDATGPDGRPCAPWAPGATIIVRVPGQYTKNKKPYDGAYVARDVAGQPAQEEGAARWLLELMLCPGGAREWFVVRAPSGAVTDHVFTVNAARGNDGHGQRGPRTSLMIADGGLSTDWRTILREHGRTLGVDVEELASVQGGLGIHSIRYLFGRYWASVRLRLDFASDMLHHGDLETTKLRYVGVDPSAASHDVAETTAATLPSSAFAGITAGELTALLDALRRENEALRRQIAA